MTMSQNSLGLMGEPCYKQQIIHSGMEGIYSCCREGSEC